MNAPTSTEIIQWHQRMKASRCVSAEFRAWIRTHHQYITESFSKPVPTADGKYWLQEDQFRDTPDFVMNGGRPWSLDHTPLFSDPPHPRWVD